MFSSSSSPASSLSTTTTTKKLELISVLTKYSNELTFNNEKYPGTDRYYQTIKIIVNTSGVYNLTSISDMDTLGYLYTNEFISSNINLNLISSDDNGDGNNQFHLSNYLKDGVSYILVFTTYHEDQSGPFTIEAYGPDQLEWIPIDAIEITTMRQTKYPIKWKQHGITVAGGHGKGNQLNQLSDPHGIFIDNDKTIYIADCYNHRIVKWKYGEQSGQIIAGGNRIDQLKYPRDMIADKRKNSLIICDRDNRQVIRWSIENKTNQQILISDIYCDDLAMDKDEFIYISDWQKHEVRRWKEGETEKIIVAGGNGKGNHLNQLNSPTFIFVDEDYSIYVSDMNNHRVMKWRKDAKEGIVVAGGNGKGNSLTHLSGPEGLIVDHLSQIYVADSGNHRVMRWGEGDTEGSTVVGGNGRGTQSNQLSGPLGLSFDAEGNLYVADCWNHRIQKFEIEFD